MRANFELREIGLQVNTQTVRNKASCLSHNFKDESIKAKMASVLHFVEDWSYSLEWNSFGPEGPQRVRRKSTALYGNDA